MNSATRTNHGSTPITPADVAPAFAHVEPRKPAAPPATSRPEVRHYGRDFDPDDCGGVWDGFGITSDADPGL